MGMIRPSGIFIHLRNVLVAFILKNLNVDWLTYTATSQDGATGNTHEVIVVEEIASPFESRTRYSRCYKS